MDTVNVCYECGAYMEARYTVWTEESVPVCLKCASEVYGACDEDEA